MAREPGSTLPPLAILVGLTGVGKSTAVNALRASVKDAILLPNRRQIADRIVIPEALRLGGQAPVPVRDRLERFRLTARYRERYPGGIAHALAHYLREEAPDGAPLMLFDNLRGEGEVRFALEAFPAARFVVLEAPAEARVLRLAGRGDAFDRVAAAAPAATGGAEASRPAGGAPGTTAPALLERLRQVPGLSGIADVAALAEAAAGSDPDTLLTGARIVAEESSHYDPAATWACLEGEPASRRVRVDTGRLPPDEVAARIRAWL